MRKCSWLTGQSGPNPVNGWQPVEGLHQLCNSLWRQPGQSISIQEKDWSLTSRLTLVDEEERVFSRERTADSPNYRAFKEQSALIYQPYILEGYGAERIFAHLLSSEKAFEFVFAVFQGHSASEFQIVSVMSKEGRYCNLKLRSGAVTLRPLARRSCLS